MKTLQTNLNAAKNKKRLWNLGDWIWQKSLRILPCLSFPQAARHLARDSSLRIRSKICHQTSGCSNKGKHSFFRTAEEGGRGSFLLSPVSPMQHLPWDKCCWWGSPDHHRWTLRSMQSASEKENRGRSVLSAHSINSSTRSNLRRKKLSKSKAWVKNIYHFYPKVSAMNSCQILTIWLVEKTIAFASDNMWKKISQDSHFS